jgi:hypothetical protein
MDPYFAKRSNLAVSPSIKDPMTTSAFRDRKPSKASQAYKDPSKIAELVGTLLLWT